MNKEKKTLGIVGGMGPEATGRCFDAIVNLTEAQNDQDHIPTLVYSNSRIPDRTKYILKDGEDPFPYIKRTAKKLEEGGADLLIMPCNTAHYFIEELQTELDITFLDMINQTVGSIPEGTRTGLLATDGTIETGIYHEYAEDRGIDIITPREGNQRKVMKVIYGKRGIKAGGKSSRLKQKILEVVEDLKNRGAGSVIAGCTEIRIVLHPSDIKDARLVRPIDEVAKKAIRLAGGNLAENNS